MARALDVVGDRWTLLIVRELLMRSPCRYTDLYRGLPGIATNLLVDRLRELERAGIVSSEAAPPPIATTLYRLTARGSELRPLVHELVRWGAPLMATPAAGDSYRSHWLSLPVEVCLSDARPDGPPFTIGVVAGEESTLLEARGGAIHARPAGIEHADAVLDGPPPLVIGVLMGGLDLDEARSRGLRYEGDPELLRRLRLRTLRLPEA